MSGLHVYQDLLVFGSTARSHSEEPKIQRRIEFARHLSWLFPSKRFPFSASTAGCQTALSLRYRNTSAMFRRLPLFLSLLWFLDLRSIMALTAVSQHKLRSSSPARNDQPWS